MLSGPRWPGRRPGRRRHGRRRRHRRIGRSSHTKVFTHRRIRRSSHTKVFTHRRIGRSSHTKVFTHRRIGRSPMTSVFSEQHAPSTTRYATTTRRATRARSALSTTLGLTKPYDVPVGLGWGRVRRQRCAPTSSSHTPAIGTAGRRTLCSSCTRICSYDGCCARCEASVTASARLGSKRSATPTCEVVKIIAAGTQESFTGSRSRVHRARPMCLISRVLRSISLLSCESYTGDMKLVG